MPSDEFIYLVENKIKSFLSSSCFVQGDVDGMKKVTELICLTDGSKRVRADLVHGFGTQSCLKIPDDRLIQMAVSAELIHAASLLHDDVIDMSSQRRGAPTANIAYGNTLAVLTGDLLYSQALEFLEDTSMAVFKDAIQVVKEMTISATIEYNQRGNINAGIQDWKKIARGKTARLFSWCTKAPAILDDADAQVIELFSQAGEFLGLAFQLADDIKDFFASESFGKTLYADIQNQNINYVLIQAMHESSEIKENVQAMWVVKDPSGKSGGNEFSDAQIKKLGKKILKLKSFQESLVQLEIWIKHSVKILQENGFQEAADSIEKLIKKILRSLPYFKQV